MQVTAIRTLLIKRECFKKRKEAWDFIEAGNKEAVLESQGSHERDGDGLL